MIPYGRQEITEADIAAVTDILRSDFLTQGPAVARFESAVALHTGAKHAVAVNSATSALHIACLALGLGKGDLLWTSPITFLASANCGLYCGADVDFVDIDPETFNMSVEALEHKLEQAHRAKRLPRVLVAVHLCGQPCDMASIHRLSQKYGFAVIEDASHAIGGKYRDSWIGSCTYSDVTVFSFHPVKVVTSAEGGMALTNDPLVAQRLELFRSHGMTRDPRMMRGADGPWYYEQVALGFNYRLTDVHAALGLSQVQRLDAYVRIRHELARRYDQLLADLPLTPQWQHPDSYSGYHLYVVRLDLARIGRTRRDVFEDLRARGIGVNVHYIPVHLQPFYRDLGFRPGDFREAERYYESALTLPLYPSMSVSQQDEVIRALREAVRA